MTATPSSSSSASWHDPNMASQRGLTERFDGSIGAASVLMPFGGRDQQTPAQAMAALLPVGPGHETKTCSVMAFGFDPYRSERNPYRGCGGVRGGVRVPS